MRNRIRATAILSVLLMNGCGGSERSLYPLTEGLTWEYQATSMSGSIGPASSHLVTLTNLPQRDLAGRTVTPQEIELGLQVQRSFVIADETGIFEYARQPAGAPEPEILTRPDYYLKHPLDLGASWEGMAETSLVMQKIRVATRTTVESVDEPVTVAGEEYSCVKTKAVGETIHSLGFFGTATVAIEEQAWFCPGIGLYRLNRREVSDHFTIGSGEVTMELIAPPRQESESPSTSYSTTPSERRATTAPPPAPQKPVGLARIRGTAGRAL